MFSDIKFFYFMQPILYFFAHDYELFRHGQRTMLRHFPQLECAGEAATPEDACAKLRHLPVDAILIDQRLAGRDALEVIPLLRAAAPSAKIILLTTSRWSQDRCLRLLQAGMDAWLGHEIRTTQQLADSICAVCDGDRFLNEWVTAPLVEKAARPAAGATPALHLTRGELNVLYLLCDDLDTAAIADRLCLSVRTVEGLRQSLKQKASCRTTHGLVSWAYRNGLVAIDAGASASAQSR